MLPGWEPGSSRKGKGSAPHPLRSYTRMKALAHESLVRTGSPLSIHWKRSALPPVNRPSGGRRDLFIVFGELTWKTAVDGCWQLMTAVDSCSDIIIIIYSLRFISIPNFSSIRWSVAEILRFEVRIEQFWQTDRDTDRHRDIPRYRAPAGSEPKSLKTAPNV